MPLAHISHSAAPTHPHAAFLFLIAIVVAAGIPLAFAWARILPEDAPPFQIEPGSFPSVDIEPAPPPEKRKLDTTSLLLLLCVTLTYLLRFPSMPIGQVLGWLTKTFSAPTASSIASTIRVILLLGTALAACLAALRPNRLRTPLIAAAGLALFLWLVAPILQSAIIAP
jgi:hypothetical protein